MVRDVGKHPENRKDKAESAKGDEHGVASSLLRESQEAKHANTAKKEPVGHVEQTLSCFKQSLTTQGSGRYKVGSDIGNGQIVVGIRIHESQVVETNDAGRKFTLESGKEVRVSLDSGSVLVFNRGHITKVEHPALFKPGNNGSSEPLSWMIDSNLSKNVLTREVTELRWQTGWKSTKNDHLSEVNFQSRVAGYPEWYRWFRNPKGQWTGCINDEKQFIFNGEFKVNQFGDVQQLGPKGQLLKVYRADGSVETKQSLKPFIQKSKD